MKTRSTKLERERDGWKAEALASRSLIDKLALEVSESWRASRAIVDHQQRAARQREVFGR